MQKTPQSLTLFTHTCHRHLQFKEKTAKKSVEKINI